VREAWDAREDIGEDVDVVYSDEDIVVANKPSGLLCVPGVSIKDSLATRVAKLYHHDRIDKMICHRLDMHTSGLVVLARSDQALKDLHAQFRERRVGKRYCAMVWGSLGPSCEGEVDLPLGPVRDDPPKQQVDVSTGKPSVTQWRILERLRGKTRVALVPVTGRSHQLRVHMAALGHPILGDYFYAHEEARGMASSLLLHAERLSCESAFLNPPPFCAANSIAPNPPVLHPITKEPLSFHIPPSF
jgi:tRNA pseudouridine32 synthase/23S rRNA pseudouridine746 synthase